MHDGQSAVLIADAATIARLLSEGGLRSSFLRVFHSTSVLDTASPRSDGARDELDDLLDSCHIVACDAALIEHTDNAGLDPDLVHKYRVNFLAKLSRRRVVVLRVAEEVAVALELQVRPACEAAQRRLDEGCHDALRRRV